MWDGTSGMRSQIAITLFDFVNIKTHEESNKYVKLLRKAWKKWIEKDKKIYNKVYNKSLQTIERKGFSGPFKEPSTCITCNKKYLQI